MSEKLLTIEEVAQYLGLSVEGIKELVGRGELPAYKIGGSFLRFKAEQVESYRRNLQSLAAAERRKREPRTDDNARYGFWERLSDFFYYNDFYILALVLLGIILFAVFEF